MLLYLKYLHNKGLSLHHIRHDKLQGNTNYDFNASLQFLDDEETTGRSLEHYISQKYPDLVKTNFIGLGFNIQGQDIDEENILNLKKYVLEPIVSKIKSISIWQAKFFYQYFQKVCFLLIVRKKIAQTKPPYVLYV